jgi:hypothetical protein
MRGRRGGRRRRGGLGRAPGRRKVAVCTAPSSCGSVWSVLRAWWVESEGWSGGGVVVVECRERWRRAFWDIQLYENELVRFWLRELVGSV